MKTILSILALTAFVAVHCDPICYKPDCNEEFYYFKHWPHAEPNKFYICVPYDGNGPYQDQAAKIWTWQTIEMTCSCGTLFSFASQNCVTQENWIRFCPSHDANAKAVPCQ
jgi:hypothetical protein